jgi:signal transduction histidine kinase
MPHDPHETPPPGGEKPVLRKVVVRPDSDPIEATDAGHATTRLSVLVHELANLLDGSLRCLSLARRTAPPGSVAAPGAEPGMKGGARDDLARRLETVQQSLERMSELVHEAGGPAAPGPSRTLPGWTGRGAMDRTMLVDAVVHAAEVMRPVAEDAGVRLDVELSPELAGMPSCSMYRVVADAIRNSVESITVAAQRAGPEVTEPAGGAGVVRVSGRIEARGNARLIVLEIADDGVGPPRSGHDRFGRFVFDFGFTTKPAGSGIGLAVARDAVEGQGGTISLRAGTSAPGVARPGAVLRIELPAPAIGDDA